MTREVHIHIDRIVLDGHEPAHAERAQAALRSELARLFGEPANGGPSNHASPIERGAQQAAQEIHRRANPAPEPTGGTHQ